MKQVKTLQYKILDRSTSFDPTIKIYNEALSYLIHMIDTEYDLLKNLSTKSLIPVVEHLIHITKQNPFPKYADFDQRFYKFPSYLRRSAISEAFGMVKSYRSHYQNWLEEKEVALQKNKPFKKKPPMLQTQHQSFPVFYKGNMFERTGEGSAKIKVFLQNDWVWVEVQFKSQDLFKRGVSDWKENNPTLLKKGKSYYLCISYQKEIKLNQTKLKDRRIVAVDLGLTNDAVCVAMDSSGTVTGRAFMKSPVEKDRMFRKLNKLKKAQRKSGYIKAPHYWRKINGWKQQIIHYTAHQIIQFALLHQADVIVFEHLGNFRAPKGVFGLRKQRMKLYHWAKQGIQNKLRLRTAEAVGFLGS